MSSILLKNASLNMSLLKNRAKIKLLKTAKGKNVIFSIVFDRNLLIAFKSILKSENVFFPFSSEGI